MRNILLLMLLGLGLSSCKKNEEAPAPPSNTQQISVNGKKYDVQYFIDGLSKLTGIAADKFYFDEAEGVFKNTAFSSFFRPDTYIIYIEQLNSKSIKE